MTTTENETKVESQAPKDETLPEATDGKDQGDVKAAATEQNSTPASPTKTKTETLKPAITVHKKDFEKDVVYLYQFPRSATVPSLSADCLKVENLFRMLGIRYENIDHKLRFKSKKGQLPFIELNGKEIEDPDFIIKELSKYFDKELDFGLTEEQKTTSHAFMSMLNNHTGWIVRWWRYNHPQEFIEKAQIDIKRAFNSRFPNAILNFVFKIGFKKQIRDTLGIASSRFTEEEICESAKEDLKALSNLLGSKDYFFGKEPHLLDCIAFAHLAQFICVPFSGIKEWMESETANLIGLVDRIKANYWQDWDEMCSTLELNTHLPKKEVAPDSEKAKNEEETKKKKEDKKKKEKKDKKDKKKDKAEDGKEEKPTETEEKKETTEGAESEKKTEAAPNGGDAPKPAEVTAE